MAGALLSSKGVAFLLPQCREASSKVDSSLPDLMSGFGTALFPLPLPHLHFNLSEILVLGKILLFLLMTYGTDESLPMGRTVSPHGLLFLSPMSCGAVTHILWGEEDTRRQRSSRASNGL